MNIHRRTSVFLFLAGLFFLQACANRKSPNDGYYFENFDNLHGWNRDALLSDEQAYSGNYALMADSLHEFSQTFDMDYHYAYSRGFRSMTVKAWGYKEVRDAAGGLVVSLESPSGRSAYASSDFSTALLQPRHWEKISLFLQFPDTAGDNSRIKIYIWSPHKSKMFVDDVTIQFNK
jgi:hypothetical protein